MYNIKQWKHSYFKVNETPLSHKLWTEPPVNFNLYTTLTNFSTKYIVMYEVHTDVGSVK